MLNVEADSFFMFIHGFFIFESVCIFLASNGRDGEQRQTE